MTPKGGVSTPFTVPSLASSLRQCIIPLRGSVGEGFPKFKPLRGTMSDVREDHSASRVATYFVFIFLAAAIIETLLASFGR